MRDHLLFIDTEASGLPKKWNVPYATVNNWPNTAQVSWIIYNRTGKEIKRENHFINDGDFEISNSAKKIHGLKREFLINNGKSRKEVLTVLINDLDEYQPLVIGHFMELDFHMVGADAYRLGLENPLAKYPTFCTMLATTHLVQNPAKKYLKLCELNNFLFGDAHLNQHNAVEDAEATARSFFRLLKRGDIDEEKIATQQKFLEEPKGASKNTGCSFLLALVFLLIITVIISL